MSNDSGDLYIGKNVTFSGSITAPNSAVIHGDVKGHLSTLNLTIGSHACIAGSVNAKTMEVFGVLRENVTCTDLLKVHETGEIHGSLEFGEIELHSGGVINGKVNEE